MSLTYLTFVWSNAPESWQIGFQAAATTMMDGIIHLHHDIMLFLCTILFFVTSVLASIILSFTEKRASTKFTSGFVNWSRKLWRITPVPVQKFHTGHGITHHTVLETVWTIIPTLILLTIATPSFALIYGLDEVVVPGITVRIVGHQWYWTYDFVDTYKVRLTDLGLPQKGGKHPVVSALPQRQETKALRMAANDVRVIRDLIILPDQLNIKSRRNLWAILEAGLLNFPWKKQTPATSATLPALVFNSYMIPTEDLPRGAFRLLETDAELTLPVHTNVRILVTAADVIHSWAVPAFGVKVDAVPGRTNEYYLHVKRLGTFYGQCSEICGVNHAFMPIKVRIVSLFEFLAWYRSKAEGILLMTRQK